MRRQRQTHQGLVDAVGEVFDTHVLLEMRGMDYPVYLARYQAAPGGIVFEPVVQWAGGDKVFTQGAKSGGERVFSVMPAEAAEGKALTDKERAAVQAAIGALQRVLSMGQGDEEEEGETGKQQDSPAGAEPTLLDSLTRKRKLAELRRMELESLEG